MLKVDIVSPKLNTISCEVSLIISDKELVGKKAPVELTVIAKFRLLKSLIPEKLNKIKIIPVIKE